MSLFSEIDRLKKELDAYRPLPTATIEALKKDFSVKNTYHSNAIEGNTLTIYETKAILEDGVTVGGKSLREHLEIINHREASLYIKSLGGSHQKSFEICINLCQYVIKWIIKLRSRTKTAGNY